MALVRVVYHEAEEQRLLKGPISEHLEDEGREVARAARSRVRVKSGKLLGSIRSESAETAGGEAQVDIPADAENNGFPYAIPLEFGATHMSDYPFLIPALEEIDG